MIDYITQILPSLLDGTKTTLLVFFITLILSLPLSLVLSFLRQFIDKKLDILFQAFIFIERGTPLLLQLMFIYFGLPFVGLRVERFTAIILAFVLNYCAYFMEIFRGGIESIDKGQNEASKTLGFSKIFTFKKIILPQAFKNCFPSIANEIVSLVKDTSLISVLGASELLKAGRGLANLYASAIPFIYVAIIYLILIAILTYILNTIERKINYESVTR